jgi:hypothetical protein
MEEEYNEEVRGREDARKRRRRGKMDGRRGKRKKDNE